MPNVPVNHLIPVAPDVPYRKDNLTMDSQCYWNHLATILPNCHFTIVCSRYTCLIGYFVFII